MRPSISIRGYVRPSVHLSVHPLVRPSVTRFFQIRENDWKRSKMISKFCLIPLLHLLLKPPSLSLSLTHSLSHSLSLILSLSHTLSHTLSFSYTLSLSREHIMNAHVKNLEGLHAVSLLWYGQILSVPLQKKKIIANFRCSLQPEVWYSWLNLLPQC